MEEVDSNADTVFPQRGAKAGGRQAWRPARGVARRTTKGCNKWGTMLQEDFLCFFFKFTDGVTLIKNPMSKTNRKTWEN